MKDIIIKHPILYQNPTIVVCTDGISIIILSPQVSTLVGITNRLIEYLEKYYTKIFKIDTKIDTSTSFVSQHVFTRCYKKHKGTIINRGRRCILFNLKLKIYYTIKCCNKYHTYTTPFLTVIENKIKNEICDWLKETGGKVFNYHYNGGIVFTDLEKNFSAI